MGKYLASTQLIFAKFGDISWTDLGIATGPSDTPLPEGVLEYVRVTVIHGSTSVNHKSISGIVNVEIFTENGLGPTRALEIADALDTLLSKRTSGTNQTLASNLTPMGVDKANPALQRHLYSIPFNFFGV